MNDFFPDLQQQLDKLTVIHYDNIKETNAPSDEELRGADTLTREEKFQVFVNVCDNMLNEGRMTKFLQTFHSHLVIMNRDQLQEAYIQWDLNQMSVEDLKQYFINMQTAELDSLDDDELIEEVEQYAPELV